MLTARAITSYRNFLDNSSEHMFVFVVEWIGTESTAQSAA